ncbi:hypothetical protein [Gordonia bronchialis]|uniref:hypothetical protein n=1 Tax=Gordonia bronchialis TaxID=2054 RepID=UPI00226D88D1|nr:hypothetical protein [Gordonia bronchialis]
MTESSDSADTATLPEPSAEPSTEPTPTTPPVDDRGGVTLAPKVKNAIIAGGVGIAVLGGLLGFGAGYIVGDSSSSTTNQMRGGPGGMNGQMPGGMNGQMPNGRNGMGGPGGMNGQMGPQGQMPPGMNGQTGQQTTPAPAA